MFFDIGAGELIGLAVLAMILVGPERLPKVAVEAAKLLKKLRNLSQLATAELKEKKQLADLMEDKPVAKTRRPEARIDPEII